MYQFNGYQIAIICLVCVLVGYVASWFMGMLDEGWRPFSKKRVIKLSPKDPKFSYGIQLGALAGYYAATGIDKTYEQIVEEYLARLDAESTK